MATFQTPARRLILTGGFAVTIAAAPAIAVFAAPTTSTPAPPVAQCAMGDVQDPATGVCMPAPAQGSLPEIQGIPCTGANTGECIGLGEEQQPPQPDVPHPAAGP